jgi:glycosyltransferase involved in cell wall biosynthesis
MMITVAICTWNRAKLLSQTLGSMRKLKLPHEIQWELLIVNNNCTDDTEEVIASHFGHLPVRSIFEACPGQSSARNAAVREARGDYIIWTDDDVLVDENWIQSYVEAFGRRPDAAVFGGPISPWFEGTPPAWLLRVYAKVAGAYAARDLGNEPCPLSSDCLPFGANFAVRMEEQRSRLYNTSLGLRPGSNLRGEETTVINSILEAGVTGWWVPGSRVKHWIPKSRQNIKYLRNFFIGQGQALAILDAHDTATARPGRPLWRTAFISELKYQMHKIFSKPETWIDHLIYASLMWGKLGLRSWGLSR